MLVVPLPRIRSFVRTPRIAARGIADDPLSPDVIDQRVAADLVLSVCEPGVTAQAYRAGARVLDRARAPTREFLPCSFNRCSNDAG